MRRSGRRGFLTRQRTRRRQRMARRRVHQPRIPDNSDRRRPRFRKNHPVHFKLEKIPGYSRSNGRQPTPPMVTGPWPRSSMVTGSHGANTSRPATSTCSEPTQTRTHHQSGRRGDTLRTGADCRKSRSDGRPNRRWPSTRGRRKSSISTSTSQPQHHQHHCR